ncbi:guanine nucleotide-binding protein G(s) subunit alpha isoform X2 [Parasteatoda tepidariorum]|uniref:guanine nucleotide-binding protein G(s) subunit alpha isoform X2 n=1 Tax=Parasteatoda tepidariorum TaxID=114398 RepID=UPI001C717FA5|nr:guanine nucleotide-binding protein G(s) subunit alpha isoform X2 [Parasteatoda tepidariorum]
MTYLEPDQPGKVYCAGESGKSTIVKQMKILHIQGFSDLERQEKAAHIRTNILEAIKEIIGNMGSLKPPERLHDDSNVESLQYIQSVSLTEDFAYPQEFYDRVIQLWSDPGVQRAFNRMGEFPLIDSTKYFLDKIQVIRKDDYSPSDKDILHCRKRTSEISRIEFTVKVPKKYGGGYQSFWMFDVGGQRGERRKWIQVFEGITAILFLVASSGFDQTIREDQKTNRLQESLSLFQDVWKSRFLKESGFILFLNKQDLLQEKMEKGAQIEKFFPEYAHYQPNDSDEVRNEYEKARCFIRDIFLVETKKQTTLKEDSYYDNRRSSKNRDCFWHYTTATDTQNVKRVFEDIHTMIVMLNLDSISPV